MKYYLHYIGSKLYPKDVFIKEAEVIGVNRCLPMRMIKKLTWGDEIFLATFEPKEKEITYKIVSTNEKDDDGTFLYWSNENGWVDKESADNFTIEEQKTLNLPTFSKWELQEHDGRKNKTDGTARVFGYFIITGLNIKASEEFKAQLIAKLNVTESNMLNTKVVRRCGSYVIGVSNVITNSIKEVIERAELLAEQTGEKIKFFVAGRFKPIDFIVEHINFSRTLIQIEAPGLPESEIEKATVSHIIDYNKRTYIKKYAKRGRPRKEKN